MEDFSFDPKSWSRQADKQRESGKKPEPPTGESKSESLPEAWRTVATDFRPGSGETPPPDTPPPPPPPAGSAAAPAPETAGGPPLAAMLAGAAALVLAGGAWAWLSRTPADEAATAQSSATGGPQPNIALPAPGEGEVERSLNLSSAAEIESALAALGVSPEEAASAAATAASALTGSGVIRATVLLSPDGEAFTLERLEATYSNGSGAVISRGIGGTFSAEKLGVTLTSEIKVVRGELDSESFYTSAVSAGVVDTLIPEFINAFAYDFNLASEVSPGDTFEVAWERRVNADGEPVGQPQLLFASLTTSAKSLALYRFVDGKGEIGWYDGNGAVTKRGFMRTPIDGARITSNFGMRFHPVLHYNRLHGGTDFAAPVGTPVYAAADGTVTSASPSRCAGNMAILGHESGYETRYFHLSRYADGLHAGQLVKQGETIGYVGNTGTCTTGPHLHYEVHINGEKVDPLSIKTDDAKRKKMDGTSLAAFRRERDRVDAARAAQAF